MKIGIPKGLLYYKYSSFINTFFHEIGVETVESRDTNKKILNEGIKYCVSEACLPLKIFHGHVGDIKDKCDAVFVPRIMKDSNDKFICPKFCALPEIIKSSIPDIPQMISPAIYMNKKNNFCSEMYKYLKKFGKNKSLIKKAYYAAENSYMKDSFNKKSVQNKYKLSVALLGHVYNVYDSFVNMNIVKKLDALKVNVFFSNDAEDISVNEEINKLYKKPFWSFMNLYGSSLYFRNDKKTDGIIYISSFACGIDSVIIELIKEKIGKFPLLVLKADEETGEAGMDTRLEAFVDMLERRNRIESDISPYGERLSCRRSAV